LSAIFIKHLLAASTNYYSHGTFVSFQFPGSRYTNPT
jgi:hypothetical protein